MATTRTTDFLSGTVPQLGDAANIETAFNSYHDSLANPSTGVAVLNRANAFTGNIAIDNGTSTALTTTGTTAALFNTGATTLNVGGAATTLIIGATTGTATIRNATVAITNAATIGTTLAVTGNTTLTGDLAVNGGDLTSSAATFNLLASPTTVNIAAAATDVQIGSTTGTTLVKNDLVINTGKTIIFEGATADTYETILTVTDPTADRTITLPNATTTLVGTDATQTLTNKTLTTPDINAGTADSLTSLSVRDTSAAYDVTLAATSSTALTAGRTLTIDLVNAARTLKLGANISANAALTINSNAVTIAGASGGSSVTLPSSGTLVNSAVTTLSSLASIGTVTTGTWNGSVIAGQYGGTGVANTGKTITVSGNTTIGSSTHTVAFATSGNTSVTLPTSGILATVPKILILGTTVTDSISTTSSTTKTSAALGKYFAATANTVYKVDFSVRFFHSINGSGANGDASIDFKFALPSGATIGADLRYRVDAAAEETSTTSEVSVYESSSISIAIDTVSAGSDTGYAVVSGSGIIRVSATAGDIGPSIYLAASNLGGPTSTASFTTAIDSYCIFEEIADTDSWS